ncbi:MAG: GNAT family N-acetyltransferase [Trueperaceae bacterium]
MLYTKGTPASYFELEKREDTINLAYFGRLPQFTGKGLGGYFLSVALAKAWAWDAQRVIVNTCTLDHESALKNYQARGFRIYK